MPACVCHSDTRFHFGSHTLRNRGLAYSWTLPKGRDNSWDQWRHRVPWMNTSFRIYACLDFEWNMDTFSLDDNPQILLELRVCTLVNVFLLPVVPQPKLYGVTTHLIGMMRVKSLSLDTCLEFAFFVQEQLSSPKQSAFIPAFSQISGTLPCSKLSPYATGTW